MRDKILKFLQAREPKLCVLATAALSGRPEAAVMGYAVLPDLTVILSTDRNSRKVVNLRANPQVALVFGWAFDELNVQREGQAEVVDGGEERKKCEEIYFASHPESAEFRGLSETIYIRVKPSWYRLSDYTVEPPVIKEESV